MYPRLFLARNLMRDDGVIFVSIDDNEVHNLRLMMNEIFGEENFVASIIWQHSIQPKGYLDKFSVHHNYTLCYEKTNQFPLNALTRTEEHNKHYSNPDNDPKGSWRSGDVRNALYRRNLIYNIVSPSGKIINAPKNGWRWSEETIQNKLKTGEIVFNKDETGIVRKIYLANVEGRAPETIWFGKEVGTTREATEELKALFNGNTPFETPKPTRLIRQMMQIGMEPESEDIILDFFAGSGTTAHAVFDLNKEDGGNRKFVLVQLAERTEEDSDAYKEGYKNIANICKERVRRVCMSLKGEIEAKAGLFDPKKLDLGFKSYTLEPSNFKVWRTDIIENESDLKNQMEAFVDPARTRSEAKNMAWEILLKSGYELTTPIEQFKIADVPVYSISGEVVLALEKITQKAIDAIIAKKPKRVICLDRLFAGNDQLKTNTALQMKDAGVEFRTI